MNRPYQDTLREGVGDIAEDAEDIHLGWKKESIGSDRPGNLVCSGSSEGAHVLKMEACCLLARNTRLTSCLTRV
jgi:hypothetical protein